MSAPTVKITHPDKVYWPDEGYTKADLIRFYDRIFPLLAPWVKDRPLMLERCPEGLRGPCFYQKEAPSKLPDGTRTVAIQHAHRVTHYVVGGSAVTQRALVNLGAVAVHVWAARARAPRRPDWMSFDLDPSTKRFGDAARAGLWLREVLDAIGLESFPKTSGGNGLHVFVPLRVGPDSDEVLEMAHRINALLVRLHPKELTVEARKQSRGDRLFLDAMRNGFAQTVAAPYSVRNRPHAPVSTPLDWSEVVPGLDPTAFNLSTFLQRRRRSPWEGFFARRQSLGAARRALAALESQDGKESERLDKSDAGRKMVRRRTGSSSSRLASSARSRAR